MSRIKSARRKRYPVKEDKQIDVHLLTMVGESIKGRVSDLSHNGILCNFENIAPNLIPTDGQILSDGKLLWENNEWSFGRSIVKYIKNENEKITLGLMFIDTLAPIQGKISKYLVLDFDSKMRDTDLEISDKDATLGDFLGIELGNIDIFAKARRYKHYASVFERSARWGYWHVRTPSKGTRVNLKKTRPDGRNDYLMMGTNDYLGLASHPVVVEAAKKALDIYGFGSTGSALTSGYTVEHEALEELLSKTLRTESATLFNSGYAANIGIISSLVNAGDFVVADILSHASIYDGMQLSQGIKRFFRHNDVDHLKKILERYREDASGSLIVLEGIFSMDGDSAPLKEIYKIAREFDSRIMIDEAHSFGILGQSGLGLVEEAGLMGGVDLTMGTFSKICGGIGGFAAGPKDVIKWINSSARSSFFSVSIPPSTAAAAKAALEVFLATPSLLENLRKNITHFVKGLRHLGFDNPINHQSAIVPVIIGDEEFLGKIYTHLMDSGVYTVPVVYPGVSRNTCRFRFTINALHTIGELDFALMVLKNAIEKVGFTPKKIINETQVA